MHPTTLHQLAKIHQAELRQSAAVHQALRGDRLAVKPGGRRWLGVGLVLITLALGLVQLSGLL